MATGKVRTVGLGDMKVCTSPSDMLVTYSLGSCVGVSICDPEAGVGGLIHCMLPLSKRSPEKAANRPHIFVDTGVVSLLKGMFQKGARRENLVIKAGGGSELLDKKQLFRVGHRNYAVLRKIMWKNDLLIDEADVGGTKSRTMYLHVGSGTTVIKSEGEFRLL